MQIALSKNAAEFAFRKRRSLYVRYRVPIQHPQKIDSQSALADIINRFLAEQSQRL